MGARPTAVIEKARKGVKSIGRAFARDIDAAFVGAASVSYADITRRFRNLEHHYVARLDGHPEYVLEIRRRIAENQLEQALLHGCGLPSCRARLKAASRLGFTNIERKAHFHLIYARGALARGHSRVARLTATAMVEELEWSLKKQKSALAKQCLLATVRFLDFMETKSRGS